MAKDKSCIEKSLLSKTVEDIFAGEEITSLESGIEHAGILCIRPKGKVTGNHLIETISEKSSARSKESISDMKNPCKSGEPTWWHTHNSTLSALSFEDRVSGGLLKDNEKGDVICAVGIEGYSCHVLDLCPPGIVWKKWGPSFFERLKHSPSSTVLLDSDEKWRLKKVKESTVHHMNCSLIDGFFSCSGIDWNTGINQFPVGVYDQVVFSGNVDIMSYPTGFGILASCADDQFECISINVGKNKKKLLYCR